jgi:hypothetical protein
MEACQPPKKKMLSYPGRRWQEVVTGSKPGSSPEVEVVFQHGRNRDAE